MCVRPSRLKEAVSADPAASLPTASNRSPKTVCESSPPKSFRIQIAVPQYPHKAMGTIAYRVEDALRAIESNWGRAFVFAYDRKELRRIELLIMVTIFSTGRSMIRFLNENNHDSGLHGFWTSVWHGNGVVTFSWHFSCLGPRVWENTHSHTYVTGTYDWLEGRDSCGARGRAVRACLLAVLNLRTAQSLDNLCRIMRAWPWVPERMRHFRNRLPTARLLPAEAVADAVEEINLDEYEILWM